MPSLLRKLQPANGFSYFLHLGLNLLLPLALLVLARIHFYQIGLLLILLSKWRMFAVRPRYWAANVRANAIDLIVGVSILVFMANSATAAWQLVWTVVYASWLIFLKPGEGVFKVSLQAIVGQTAGLMMLFVGWGGAPLYILVAASWLICYVAARHFLTAFEETHTELYATIWGYFAGALTWVLGHWLLYYRNVAQVTLLLTVLAFGLGTLYYLERTDRLSTLLQRQIVFIMIAIVVVVIVFSDWSSKVL